MNALTKSDVHVLLFSKDRALQCDAALQSFRVQCADAAATAVTVLYACSDARHERTYSALAEEWNGQPLLRFLRQQDFRTDVLALLAEGSFTVLAVDDTLFVRPFSLARMVSALIAHPAAIGFSLRLGLNTRYCYPFRKAQPHPAFVSEGDDMLRYRWPGAAGDFGYPLEVSSSLFPSAALRSILQASPFLEPSTMESALASTLKRLGAQYPELLAFKESRAFSNPVNRVQHVAPNRFGSYSGYDPDSLARCFEAGARLDVAAYDGFIPNACHQEMPLQFMPNRHVPELPEPRLTVVMPTRNAAPFLHEAVESILAQTMSNFEFIIVEDASTDGSAAVLAAFHDPRLRIVRNDRQRGQTISFNLGAEQARGEFLARMDADDISDPSRFEKQIACFDAKPDLGVCGTWTRIFGDRTHDVVSLPVSHEAIAAGMLFRPHIANPSVMMRTAVFLEAGGFDTGFAQAEDYELWSRLIFRTRFANSPEVLLAYRSHPGQIGRALAAQEDAHARRVQAKLLERIGLYPTPDEAALHFSLGICRWETRIEYLASAGKWLQRIRDANAASLVFDAPALDSFLGELWFSMCAHATPLGFQAWQAYRASTLRDLHAPAIKKRARFLLHAAARKRR